MQLFNLALLISTACVAVLAAPRGGFGNRWRPVDEILAIAGDMKHGRANPRGRNPSFGFKRNGGREEVVEYDILRAVPEVQEGEGLPADLEPHKVNNGGRGQTKKSERGNGRPRGGRGKRHATTSSSSRWTNGVVPYTFAANMGSAARQAFEEAVAEYTKFTCIKWKPRGSETDYVEVADAGSGCYSWIGKIGGKQGLNINQPNCIYKTVIIHEMLHALGVFHQHTRPDRDTYVTIQEANIQSGAAGNFDKRTDTALFGTPYDYRSIMHYGRKTFSSNGGDVIVTTDPAFLDVIGGSPTLSFRDIQLINAMYNCPALASCPAKECPSDGFQGHDCECKCATVTGNYDVPAVSCNGVCGSVSTPCDCQSWSESCSNLPNTHCDLMSKACECDDGHIMHNGVCTLTTSITCTSLETDCKCSHNSGSCDQLSNSECDASSDTCVCQAGYINKNGVCQDINSVACDVADKSCGCSAKGSSACGSVPNSFCDSGTDACVCDSGYYNNNGVCTQAPSCTTMDSPCHCEVQGASACSAIANTECNAQTGACECPGLYVKTGGQCIRQYSSDGSAVSPFVHTAASQVSYQPTQSSSSETDNGAFGIAANGYYLYAGGKAGEKAIMETGYMTVQAGEAPCFKMGVDLNHSKVRVTQYIGEPATSWNWRYVHYHRNLGYYYTYQKTYNTVSATTKVKYVIETESYSDTGDWSVKIDPIYFGVC